MLCSEAIKVQGHHIHNVERPLAATGTRGEDMLCLVTNMVS